MEKNKLKTKGCKNPIKLNIMKEQKTNLTKAYDRLRQLNLAMTTEEYIELTNILFDLANDQFEKGMEVTTGIYNKNK